MTMEHFSRRVFILFTVYFACILENRLVSAQDLPQIISLSANGDIGNDTAVICQVVPEKVEVGWLFKGKPIAETDRIKVKNETRKLPEKDLDGNTKLFVESRVSVRNTTSAETGNYTCIVKYGDVARSRHVILNLSFAASLVNTAGPLKTTVGPLKKNIGENATFTCLFKVYENREVRWSKIGVPESSVVLKSVPLDSKHVTSTYEINDLKRNSNGTYKCEIFDPISNRTVNGTIDLLVLAEPQVQIDYARAIGAHKIYLNWTVNTGNLPIKQYLLSYRALNSSNTNGFTYWTQRIDVENTSAVLDGLEPSTLYQLQMEGFNSKGKSTPNKYHRDIKTMETDPNFVPNITINGFSATSVTIGWAPPPDNTTVMFYELEAKEKDKTVVKQACHYSDKENLPYMFEYLEPHSTYLFRVRACALQGECMNWTSYMEAVTLDGIPGKPDNVRLSYYEDDVGTRHFNLSWEPPLKPNAEIKGYTIELTGNATYYDHFGMRRNDTWGPLSKFVTTQTVRFDDLKPNTHYTVRLSAVTRTRRRGDEEVRHYTTRPAPPDAVPKPRWRKIYEDDKYLFKVYIPRVTERNGPICCYRVHMVRLGPNTNWTSLKNPQNMPLITYDEAHDPENPKIGAYITDIFTNKKFPADSELIIGDGNTTEYNSDICPRCKEKRTIDKEPPKETTTTSTATTTDIDDGLDVTESTETSRKRRMLKRFSHEKTYFFSRDGYRYKRLDQDAYDAQARGLGDLSDANYEKKPRRDDELTPMDGTLDANSNYTLFVEVVVDNGKEPPMFTNYLNALIPAPTAPTPRPYNAIELALQVTCGILAMVLLGMIIFCILHTRRTRKLPANAVEMNSLQATLRSIYRGLKGGRHQRASYTPPDMTPIARDELAAAFAERQADSDYGFQREFEMLPEGFVDRTTHASEARENQPKNRYPDIKAYDQTRVRLSQIDSVIGSDYINANYVMGYKDPMDPNQECKKFICAQGPTDATVNDFWRMVWEQGLELIVMLTNLEEYSKVKCSKYWPDELRGIKAFGAINVQHISEKRYSDYIVRELKISKQPTNAEGQPIVENNGIAKRNGDCKDSSPSGSAPTSPRDWKSETGDRAGQNGTGPSERIVRQYHFLVWKDFAAPEHPHSILKFIKRVNEAWASLMGRPVVVHCSAGVGRTGTLVALDCLLQQLRAENQVSVFNTVAELRRQRNFLVQSLKQYVFVYRALVEYAHYGDSEIPASRLKASVDRLRNTPEGADKCLMEEDFERMISSPLAECAKSCAAGAADELRARNRSEECLPYDRNRVILTPLPNKDFSTYINASFIEAYDNSEGFIITQDPLPGTIADFWRMVSEHGVSTIVMLSELGDGERKCPRYWDDGSAQYEHMTVQYEQSESCPYYTRREFRLTNNKSGEVSCVRQLQYHGWPTVNGQVPEVTRGLAEVADAAEPCARLSPAPAANANATGGAQRGPMLVHCHLGTERSSMFVALCILICQLRVERRVDVSCVARKVRSQRAHTIDTFLQYEFLHRAILNYAELHNLLEDS